MWKEKFLTLLFSLDKRQLISAGLFLFGLVILTGGLIASLSSSKPDEISFEPFDSAQDVPSAQSKILVDVSGAVVSPGVHNLSADARIKDALVAASGLSEDADREWVSKNLNLAAKIKDGVKIYIPKIGEVRGEKLEVGNAGVISASGLININSASSSELDSLPGIGQVTANKIIDNRPYSQIEELRSKKVVGASVFEKIKDKISVY